MCSFGFVLTYLLHDVGQINHILILTFSVFYFSKSSVIDRMKRCSSNDRLNRGSANELSRFDLTQVIH